MASVFYIGRSPAVVRRLRGGGVRGGPASPLGPALSVGRPRPPARSGPLPARARIGCAPLPNVTLAAGILPSWTRRFLSLPSDAEASKKGSRALKGCPRSWRAGGKRGTPASGTTKAMLSPWNGRRSAFGVRRRRRFPYACGEGGGGALPEEVHLTTRSPVLS